MRTGFGFLVVGAGRGGTSLIAALLDSHPQLAVAFERHAKAYLMGGGLEGEAALRFDTRAEGFHRACVREAARHPGCLWGNKITTEQLAALEAHNRAFPDRPVAILDAFFNRVLAEQKQIFILRDGRTCVRSKMARTGQSLETACERWLYSVRVHEFLSRQSKAMCIKYETLLTEPVTTLSAVCAFLGVAYDERMLAGTRHARMNPEYRHPGFDLTKLGLEDIPAGCEARLADALRACGYLSP